jgi:O-antigen ligase
MLQAKSPSGLLPYLITAGTAIALVVLNFSLNIDPVWILLGGLLLAFTLLAMLKFPAAFMAPAIFIGSFKAQPYFVQFQEKVDLTLVVLLLLSMAVLCNFLLGLTRSEGWSLRALFAGQGMGVVAWFLFVGMVAIGYTYTPAPGYGWVKLTRFSAIGSLLFFSPLFLLKQDKDIRHFAVAATVFAMLLAAQRLHAVFTHSDVSEDVTRIGAGHLLGMTILLLLYYRLVDRGFLRMFLLLVCLPLLAAGLVACLARGPIVSLALALALGALVFRGKASSLSRRRIALSGVALFIASFVLAVYWVAPATEGRFQQKTAQLEDLVRGRNPRGSAGARLEFYRSALTAVAEKPLLGWGTGGWSVYYYGQDQRAYPHNLLLEVLVEQGLLGFTALLIFLGTLFVALKRMLVMAGPQLALFPTLVVFCLSNTMFAGDLDDNRLLWFCCGIALAGCRMVRNQMLGQQVWPVSASPRRVLSPRDAESPTLPVLSG